MNNQNYLPTVVKTALAEDIGSGDVSASLLPNQLIKAQVISKEVAVICGLEYFAETFRQVDNDSKLTWKIKAGQAIKSGQILCEITGFTQSIISAERVALNFLQTLSATATQTRFLVNKISHTHTQLLDTRKTLPNLRLAQKQAVVCGGGVNHRMGLYDCVMLKENHLIALGSIDKALQSAKQKYPNLPLIIEVENLTQLSEVLACPIKPMRILCDNFNPELLTQAVTLVNKKIPLEASGNIDERNIALYAQTGVDYISVGSMTKNIRAIDLSLRFLID